MDNYEVELNGTTIKVIELNDAAASIHLKGHTFELYKQHNSDTTYRCDVEIAGNDFDTVKDLIEVCEQFEGSGCLDHRGSAYFYIEFEDLLPQYFQGRAELVPTDMGHSDIMEIAYVYELFLDMYMDPRKLEVNMIHKYEQALKVIHAHLYTILVASVNVPFLVSEVFSENYNVNQTIAMMGIADLMIHHETMDA